MRAESCVRHVLGGGGGELFDLGKKNFGPAAHAALGQKLLLHVGFQRQGVGGQIG